MPYSRRKKKGGGVTLTNTQTGAKHEFESERKAENWERVAEAVKHGFKPTGKGRKKR